MAAAADFGFDSVQSDYAIAVAKVTLGQVVPSVVTTAHQLHGAIGVTIEHRLWLATMRAAVGSRSSATPPITRSNWVCSRCRGRSLGRDDRRRLACSQFPTAIGEHPFGMVVVIGAGGEWDLGWWAPFGAAVAAFSGGPSPV